MAKETANETHGTQVMDAEVKGRVPKAWLSAIKLDVAARRKRFPRASKSDVVRDALSLYFETHDINPNGKAGAHKDNGR